MPARERPQEDAPPIARPLFLLNVVVALVLSAAYLPAADFFREPRAASWAIAVWLTYPWLYLAPAALLAASIGVVARIATRRAALAARIGTGAACILLAAVQLTLLADQRVLALYGFHLNGFVWNLLTTPGGIAALGAGSETFAALAVLAAAVLGLEILATFALARAAARPGRLAPLVSARFLLSLALGFVALSGYERIAFGWSRVTGYRPVLEAEEAFPFYQRTSFNKLARRLGLRVADDAEPRAGLRGDGLAYPRAPLAFRPGAARPNVVVLCSESLRADALAPATMPATWARAQRGLRFANHLSAGNGTRMGVFGLFYGLPGPYWFRMLNAQRGPALLHALRERGYAVRAFTADDFSYPEFAQTVFADEDRSELREYGGKGLRQITGPTPSWQRDRAMVAGIDEYLERRDPSRPFFVYAFFESPHARYEFPDETARFRPYLESFDYVTMDLERDIEKVHNRYRNSVLHLDSQIERVLASLEARALLDSTIVVITGDHGEEFLEQGRWGHNSAFSEAQIRVPLVLLAPGVGAGVVERLTSHLDVPATLLDLLGAESPASDYSLGQSLLRGPERKSALVSDWKAVTYVDAEGKVEFPMRGGSFAKRLVRGRDDRPLRDPPAYLAPRAPLFVSVIEEMGRFSARLH